MRILPRYRTLIEWPRLIARHGKTKAAPAKQLMRLWFARQVIARLLEAQLDDLA
jgi:hypothetical protein